MDLVHRFSVDRPAAYAFAYLIAVERTPEWNRNVRSARILTAGPLIRGTTFEETRSTIGGLRRETFNVVEFDANRRFGVAAADGSEFSWRYELEDQGVRTQVTTRLTIPLARRMPILEPLVAPIARRRFADNMRHLRSRIAGGAGLGIDSLERVRFGDSDQWILLRGRDRSKPVVLVIGQGPDIRRSTKPATCVACSSSKTTTSSCTGISAAAASRRRSPRVRSTSNGCATTPPN